jgi:hypothetical protein
MDSRELEKLAMPDLKDLLRDIIQDHLEHQLKALATKQIPVPDKPEYKFCPEGFIEGLVRIEGKISAAGEFISPAFAKSKTYLGDGTFDLRVELAVDSVCKNLRTVIQGVLDISELALEWDYSLGPANIVKIKVKVKIGPLSFHFRVYECPKQLSFAPEVHPHDHVVFAFCTAPSTIAVMPTGGRFQVVVTPDIKQDS